MSKKRTKKNNKATEKTEEYTNKKTEDGLKENSYKTQNKDI